MAGHRYRTAAGRIAVDAVDVVDPARISGADARRAGYPDRAALLDDLRGDDSMPTYRIRFHAVEGPDERAELAAQPSLSADERADLDRRLDRLDRASSHGPWTRAVLETIGQHPGVRAADLALGFGRRSVQARCAQAEEPRPDDQPRGRLPAVTRSEAYLSGRLKAENDPHSRLTEGGQAS